MSNALTVRPISITTVMATGHQVAVSAQAGNTVPVYVKRISWVGPTTAGDTVTIIDPISSTILFTAKAATADIGRTLVFEVHKPWRDYQVTVLSSGTLRIAE
jgi:hypothetical protein